MAQRISSPPAILNEIAAFRDLPAEVHAWLLVHGELRHYEPDEIVVTAGSPADVLLGVVAGGVHYYSKGTGQDEVRYRMEAGQVGGVLPYSRLQIFRGEGRAAGKTTIYSLPRSQFSVLEQVSPELVQRLVSIMSDRAREEVRLQERDDKLRALGKLSAGLSHELNNPAAAIGRAADALNKHLCSSPMLLKNLMLAGPPTSAMVALKALASESSTYQAPKLSALARADQEDELADWLETQGVPDGHLLSTGLLDAGLTAEKLGPLLAQLPAPARAPALAWLEAHLTALRLTHDIREASQRISTLVSDVKTYSHMDRAGGREQLAITTGLDSTLNIFAYALRQKNVHLARDYAPQLPPVLGQAGSLNQVWTNLIDNALDALPEKGGTLAVRVAPQQGGVCVSILDNGSGITPEVLAHMFEPFYTTKPPGEGSGQGLDIARRIVQEHGGRLEATSEPGRTEFKAWLPAAR